MRDGETRLGGRNTIMRSSLFVSGLTFAISAFLSMSAMAETPTQTRPAAIQGFQGLTSSTDFKWDMDSHLKFGAGYTFIYSSLGDPQHIGSITAQWTAYRNDGVSVGVGTAGFAGSGYSSKQGTSAAGLAEGRFAGALGDFSALVTAGGKLGNSEVPFIFVGYASVLYAPSSWFQLGAEFRAENLNFAFGPRLALEWKSEEFSRNLRGSIRFAPALNFAVQEDGSMSYTARIGLSFRLGERPKSVLYREE